MVSLVFFKDPGCWSGRGLNPRPPIRQMSSPSITDLMIRQRRRQWKRSWKIDFASFTNFFALIPSHPVTGKERRSVGTEEGRPRPISDRESKIYRFAVPVLKSTQNLVMSSRSCAGTAKKWTKKRDARAALLFCSLNLLLFWRFRCQKPDRRWVRMG